MVRDGSDDAAGHESEVTASPASFRTERDRHVVIHVGGELDAQSGTELTTLLTEAFRHEPEAVVVDLTELDFVDSVGLSVLVSAHHRGRAEGIPFEVHNVSPSCMRVFEITQLVDVLDLR
jgi:anti-sigma B factor antagonist